MPRLRKEGVDVGPWHGIIKGAQGNFDHLMGVVRRIAAGHNSLVDDVSDLRDFVEQGLEDTATGQHNHTDAGDSHDGGVLMNDEHDGYSEYTEIGTPSTPGANKARLYAKDNGAGKTQLVVIFSGGVEQVIATDP